VLRVGHAVRCVLVAAVGVAEAPPRAAGLAGRRVIFWLLLESKRGRECGERYAIPVTMRTDLSCRCHAWWHAVVHLHLRLSCCCRLLVSRSPSWGYTRCALSCSAAIASCEVVRACCRCGQEHGDVTDRERAHKDDASKGQRAAEVRRPDGHVREEEHARVKAQRARIRAQRCCRAEAVRRPSAAIRVRRAV
jgi:hypothetical protein